MKRTAGMSYLVTLFMVRLEALGLGKSFVSGLPGQEE